MGIQMSKQRERDNFIRSKNRMNQLAIKYNGNNTDSLHVIGNSSTSRTQGLTNAKKCTDLLRTTGEKNAQLQNRDGPYFVLQFGNRDNDDTNKEPKSVDKPSAKAKTKAKVRAVSLIRKSTSAPQNILANFHRIRSSKSKLDTLPVPIPEGQGHMSQQHEDDIQNGNEDKSPSVSSLLAFLAQEQYLTSRRVRVLEPMPTRVNFVPRPPELKSNQKPKQAKTASKSKPKNRSKKTSKNSPNTQSHPNEPRNVKLKLNQKFVYRNENRIIQVPGDSFRIEAFEVKADESKSQIEYNSNPYDSLQYGDVQVQDIINANCFRKKPDREITDPYFKTTAQLSQTGSKEGIPPTKTEPSEKALEVSATTSKSKSKTKTIKSKAKTTAPPLKKKLQVKGLHNFVNKRGSNPPAWVKDFPIKSKFHPDNYLYDFEQGASGNAKGFLGLGSGTGTAGGGTTGTTGTIGSRLAGLQKNSTKKSGRCDTCGIYSVDTCRCCKKCQYNCACPTPPQTVPNLNQAFCEGWSQAQKVIEEMTQNDLKAPVGINPARISKKVFVNGQREPQPHLKCHIDVLNPTKDDFNPRNQEHSYPQFYHPPSPYGYCPMPMQMPIYHCPPIMTPPPTAFYPSPNFYPNCSPYAPETNYYPRY